MDKKEFAEWFDGTVRSRWPKSSFSAVDIWDWYYRFGSYGADVLTEAVRKHRVEDEPSRPSMRRMYRYLIKMRKAGKAMCLAEKYAKEDVEVAADWQKWEAKPLGERMAYIERMGQPFAKVIKYRAPASFALAVQAGIVEDV